MPTDAALLALLALLAAPAPAAPPPAPAAAPAGHPSPATAGSAVPTAATPPTAPADHRKENKALVRRYLTEVLAQGRMDDLDAIVAKTFVDQTPGAPNLRGPTVVRQARLKISALFTQAEYDLQELVAEDDRVAARYLVLALPKPDRADRSRPAPQPLVINGMAVFHVRAGRIQDVYVINDQANMLRQLGYTLVPPGAPQPAARGGSPPAQGSPQQPNSGMPNAGLQTSGPQPSNSAPPQSKSGAPPTDAGPPRSTTGSPPFGE